MNKSSFSSRQFVVLLIALFSILMPVVGVGSGAAVADDDPAEFPSHSATPAASPEDVPGSVPQQPETQEAGQSGSPDPSSPAGAPDSDSSVQPGSGEPSANSTSVNDGATSRSAPTQATEEETQSNEPRIATRNGGSTALACENGAYYGIGRTTGKIFKMTGDGHGPVISEETGLEMRHERLASTANGIGIGMDGRIAYAFTRPTFMDGIAVDYLYIERWDATNNKVKRVYHKEFFEHFPSHLTGGRVKTGAFFAGAVPPHGAEYYFGGFSATRNTHDPKTERDIRFNELRHTEHDYGGPLDAYLWSTELVIHRYVPTGDPFAANPTGRVEKVGTVQLDNYIARLGVESVDETNGDFAFDRDGNLIAIYSNSDRGRMRVITIPRETLEAELAKPEDQRGRMEVPYSRINHIPKGYRPNGLAMATDGVLINSWSDGTSGTSYITRIDPVTGELLEPSHMEGNPIQGARWGDVVTDLASCNASFPRLMVDKNFVERVDGSDQVHLAVNTVNDVHNPYTYVQTSGTATGIQPQRIEPFPVRTETSYYISETLVGRQNSSLDEYNTSFSCAVDGQTLPVTRVDAVNSKPGSHLSADATIMYRLDVPESLRQHPNAIIRCRFVNKPETPTSDLTLIKKVKPVAKATVATAMPDEFTLRAADSQGTFVTGANGVTLNAKPGRGTGQLVDGYYVSEALTATELEPGTYTLSEVIPANRSQYAAQGEWSCRTEAGQNLPALGGKVELPEDAKVTCEVVNATAELTLLKHFPNGDPAEITMTIRPDGDGDPVLSTPGSATVGVTNSIHVTPGATYVLGEQADIAYLRNELQIYVGNNPTNPDMTNDRHWRKVNSNRVTVPAGQHAVYRYVNTPPPEVAIPLTGGISRDAIVIGGIVTMLIAATTLGVGARRRSAHSTHPTSREV